MNVGGRLNALLFSENQLLKLVQPVENFGYLHSVTFSFYFVKYSAAFNSSLISSVSNGLLTHRCNGETNKEASDKAGSTKTSCRMYCFVDRKVNEHTESLDSLCAE